MKMKVVYQLWILVGMLFLAVDLGLRDWPYALLAFLAVGSGLFLLADHCTKRDDRHARVTTQDEDDA